jgi:anthranilate phosphoribosyltransferase
MIKECIQKLVESSNLSYTEAQGGIKEILSGEATNAQIAAFLVALRMKGETVEEVTALAEVMREECTRICPSITGRLIDTCGTGGDKLKTFNISTASAFVVAGAGVAIAKHGNRAVTSKSGSADVLEYLGLNLNMQPADVQRTIEQLGIGFLFAPAFHPAMKYAVAPRKEVGIRTIFNLLGPLTNPASANAQLLGTYDAKLTVPLAHTLKNLGCTEAMIVHGLNGIDEISTIGKTRISHLKDNKVVTFETVPKDFGVKKAKIEQLQGTNTENNAHILFKILSGYYTEKDPKIEVTLVNSAAGLMVGGKADNFKVGIEIAQESIRSGAAFKKLEALIKTSGGNLTLLEELEKKYE